MSFYLSYGIKTQFLDLIELFNITVSSINWLEVLIYANLLTILGLVLVPDGRSSTFYIKLISIFGAAFQLLFVGLICVVCDKVSSYAQFNVLINYCYPFDFIYHLAVDGLSIYFLVLSVLLLPVCVLCSWSTVLQRVREFYILLQVITLLLINVFCVRDLLLFYIFFESVLIPMFLIIGVWGSRDRKIHAAYQFFLYTLVGSVLMLLSIIYLYDLVGSTHIEVLYNATYTLLEERLIWLAFFLSFAVKVPMIPFHIWLPEAHVEAPTAGSVLLAGILLKMGTYGLIRFSLPMFPEATVYFQPLVFTLSMIGIIYAACTTIRQVDLKKIIAYSSVGHMNYVTLGILSNNLYGLEGSIYLMLGHGFVSSALFLCVGLLYERYHTRVVLYYGGLIFGMPLFGCVFLFFTLANVSLPGTSNFIGEILVLAGVFNVHFVSAFVGAVGAILGAVYAIWLYNRVLFGEVKVLHLTKFSDLNRKEAFLMINLIVIIVLTGIYPSILTDSLHPIMGWVLQKQL